MCVATQNGWNDETEDEREIEQLSDQPCGYRLYNSRQRISGAYRLLERSRQDIEQSRVRGSRGET